MAEFNPNNFVIDHALRGIMTSTEDGSYMWSINQITEPSLEMTSESTDAVDALGSRIMTFDRAKEATFSGQNSLFDLGLLAAQSGTAKVSATADNKMVVPTFETIDVASASAVLTLKHTPTQDVKSIYVLNSDGTLGQELKGSASAGNGKFVYDASQKKITLGSDVAVGSQVFVMYDYESDQAVGVTNTAKNFPRAGKFVLEVLGCDVCNPSVKIHAYIIFPNAKLDPKVTIDFKTDGNHPFSVIAQQAYCDKEKTLFKIIIPKTDAE